MQGFGQLPQTTPKLYWKNPKPFRLLGKKEKKQKKQLNDHGVSQWGPEISSCQAAALRLELDLRTFSTTVGAGAWVVCCFCWLLFRGLFFLWSFNVVTSGSEGPMGPVARCPRISVFSWRQVSNSKIYWKIVSAVFFTGPFESVSFSVCGLLVISGIYNQALFMRTTIASLSFSGETLIIRWLMAQWE